MSSRVALIWDEAYAAYDFGPQHPLKPVRVLLTIDLARACGLLELPNVEIVPPRAATRAELATIHHPEYIDAIAALSASAVTAYGDYGWGIGVVDNPAFPGMHEASELVAGGSIVAAEQVWSGAAEHAFNPAGGLHHAMADRAWGFCIYNDPAIAIRWLLDHGVARVAYVDVDVHHGDGVQAAFYGDPRVLTVSLHETGEYLFPGTGFAAEVGSGDAEGTKVNVPLPPFTDDDAYRAAFERVVPPLLSAFRPEILVTQLGCDTHATDPLAHMALTTRSYRYLAESFHNLAHELTGGRWIAVGGGGYQVYAVVPRAWTIYFSELAGGTTPEFLPPEWVQLARKRGAGELPVRFDDPGVLLPPGRRAEATDRARSSADETAARLFPYYGLKS